MVYTSSRPIPSHTVEYMLSLLPDVSVEHAKSRLLMASCMDGRQVSELVVVSSVHGIARAHTHTNMHHATPQDVPLSEKLLMRPRMLERIRAFLHAPPPEDCAEPVVQCRAEARHQLYCIMPGEVSDRGGLVVHCCWLAAMTIRHHS